MQKFINAWFKCNKGPGETHKVIFIFFSVALGPVSSGPGVPGIASEAMSKSRRITEALQHYAETHDGHYPAGNSSTEIFQVLLDSHEIAYPELFWAEGVPGKQRPKSSGLTPENVCFDVTVPLEAGSSSDLPLVFLTGYRVNYVSTGKAIPLPSSRDHTWMVVGYQNRSACVVWRRSSNPDRPIMDPDGSVQNFVPKSFSGIPNYYRQLTP